MAATVWEPLPEDFGTLQQREFHSIDDAVRYAVEAVPESVRYVVVISLIDGSLIEPSEIQQRYGDISAGPKPLAIEQATHSVADVLHLLRSCLLACSRFNVWGIAYRLKPTVGSRLVA
ncbi:MAG: hypothetical protein ACLGJC_33825 [Alphaproteobacteria bacterium]